jgi:hypothetical protein
VNVSPQSRRRDRMAAQTYQHVDGVIGKRVDIAAGRGRIQCPVLLEVGFDKVSRSAFLAAKLIGDIHIRQRDLLLYGSIASVPQFPGNVEDDSFGLRIELSQTAQSEERALRRPADGFKYSQRRLCEAAILQPFGNRVKDGFHYLLGDPGRETDPLVHKPVHQEPRRNHQKQPQRNRLCATTRRAPASGTRSNIVYSC